jgi:large subunit ribosomal protein L32e
MTTEIKRLIGVRVAKGAKFKRDGYGKKRQLSDSWRKPKGQHNKQREQKKAKGALPKPGFGSPIAVRGMHPSGFFEALIASENEIEGLNNATHAIRISATVGGRKRSALQEKAISAGFKVLNPRVAKAAVSVKKPTVSGKGEAKETKKDVKKGLSSRISEALSPKKEATKAKPVAEGKKETPAKAVKKAEKPAAEKAPEKSSDKPKAKSAAKPAKTTDKPAAAKSVKAEAKAKPATAKKTGSGVKKNE